MSSQLPPLTNTPWCVTAGLNAASAKSPSSSDPTMPADEVHADDVERVVVPERNLMLHAK